MHVTIDRVKSNPEDFKVCAECGHINWYENNVCVMCGSDKFRKVRNKDIAAMEAIYGEDGEVDV